MGIHGLSKLLADEAPACMKEVNLKSLVGRKVAVDASMALYSFLIAIRSRSSAEGPSQMLTNESGEVTSHVQGMFSRTIRLLSCGVKPAYVFDGKPPTFKSGELARRYERRQKAEKELIKATENENVEDIDKFSRQTVKMTPQHSTDCQKLLHLMGVPVIIAPSEAEAQCAELARAGKVYATATEDMDALTFATPKLLRKLTFSSAKDEGILEVDVNKVLEGLGLTQDEFIDLCILCGCDYTDRIRGIGPKNALKLIKKHRTIENIIKNIDKSKYVIPTTWLPPTSSCNAVTASMSTTEGNDASDEELTEGGVGAINGEEGNSEECNTLEDVKEESVKEEEEDIDAPAAAPKEDSTNAKHNNNKSSNVEDNNMKLSDTDLSSSDNNTAFTPAYVEARRLFKTPQVNPGDTQDITWKDPDEEGLRDFLVNKMQFSEDRVNAGIKKLKDARKAHSQQRLDSYFKVLPSSSTGNAAQKRKLPPSKGKRGNTLAAKALKKGVRR